MKEELLSVGIDLGTSTTQLIFSKLIVENMASSYTVPRMVIADKQIIYKSEIYFTPLLGESQNRIDFEKIRDIVDDEYKKAGIRKEQIDTGAVIITGETARKENAREVVNALGDFAGDFVVATAGPDLESVISGKGAGADDYSKEHHTTVVNIDIGGGTSNLAVFQRGDTCDTGCLDIGGRLIKADADTHRITYIAPKLQEIIQREHLPLAVGDTATEANVAPVIAIMVSALEASVGLKPQGEYYQLLVTHRGIEFKEPIPYISFSGGVAEAVYQSRKFEDKFCYGDIGILLGEAIARSELCRKMKVIESRERIRATVVGAGSHTTEISGSTITYTKDTFPVKNLPVLKISPREEQENLAESLRKKIEWFEVEDSLQPVAVALTGAEHPTFAEVQTYAGELLLGMKALMERGLPVIVIVERDMAKVLGQSMYALLGYGKDVVCLDGVRLQEGDYIDIGRPIAQGSVLPVVVKTLVFHS